MRNEETTGDAAGHDGDGVVTVALADPRLPESLTLVQHFWDELGRLYGDTGPCQFKPEDVEGPGAAFVLARAPADVRAGTKLRSCLGSPSSEGAECL